VTLRADLHEQQIDCSVIVEIRQPQTYGSPEVHRRVGHVRQARPRPVAVVIHQPRDGSAGLHNQKIKGSAVTRVRRSNRLHRGDISRHAHLAEIPAALIVEDVQLARAVDQRRVRQTIIVEVRPDELLYSGNAGEQMNRRESAVTVIAQDGGSARRGAKHHVEVAVGLNIQRPCAGVAAVDNHCRQLRFRRNVGEVLRRILAQETHAARTGEDEIRLEVVIEVDRQD
jgi:hypothetical protein